MHFDRKGWWIQKNAYENFRLIVQGPLEFKLFLCSSLVYFASRFIISLKILSCNLKLSFDTVSQRLLGKPSILFSRLCLIAFSQLILKEHEMQSDFVSIWDWYFSAVFLWQLLSQLYICENKLLKLNEQTVGQVWRSMGHTSSILHDIGTMCHSSEVVNQNDLGSNPNLVGTLGYWPHSGLCPWKRHLIQNWLLHHGACGNTCFTFQTKSALKKPETW